MILSNLFASLMQLILKPKMWIPLIGLIIISTAITIATIPLTQGLMFEFALSSGLTGELDLGLVLYKYFFEIILLIILIFFISTLGIMAYISTSKIVRGEKLVKAINDSIKEYRKAVGVTIMFWGLFLSIIFVVGLLAFISGIIEVIGMLLLGLLLIIVITLFVKLVFTIPALTKNEIRKAVEESWEFTNKRFWGALIYLLLVGLIIIVISSIFVLIDSILVGTILDIPFAIVEEVFPILFFICATTNYFYSK